MQNFDQHCDADNQEASGDDTAGEKKGEQKTQDAIGAKAFDDKGPVVDVVASPVYSTAVGLVLWGYRNRARRGGGVMRPAATGTFGKVTGRLMGWLSDFF